MSPKKNPRRKRSNFGKYLKKLRERKTGLSVAAAARELRFNSRQQLDSYETKTKPPDSTLIEIARFYHVSYEEILREAYWPQLIFVPLIYIVEPDGLSKDLMKELEKGLKEKERIEITEHIGRVLLKRRKNKVGAH